MCRNQHNPHLERKLAAIQEARGGEGLGESQEEGRTKQIVQGGENRRSGCIYLVLAKLRTNSTTA